MDRLDVDSLAATEQTMQLSKAFRFVNVQYDAGVSLDAVSMLYEYADVQERGIFTCNDEEINRIYDVSKYTFELNTRNFS